MSETPTPHTQDEFLKKSAERAKGFTRKQRLTATGLVFAAGVGAGVAGTKGVEAIVDHFEHEPVAEVVATLEPGQSVIGLIEEWVPSLALDAEVDPAAIPYSLIVEEGQQAAKEMFVLTGETARQPGEQYTIELTKNDANQYGLEVSPYEQPLIESGLPPLDEQPLN